jgi:hypothetical protein
MIKFFRLIRKKLLSENRLGKYLLYALGEIVLVVIGILIALQINNWNEDKKDRKLERQYLIGLTNDLQIDSVALDILISFSNDQVRRKKKLHRYFDGESFTNDSLAHFFAPQWGMAVGFNPNTTTLDEMKNTGGIALIQEQDIRKNIIQVYNSYESFITGCQAYYERNRFELRRMVFKIPYVFGNEALSNTVGPDIVEALNNHEIRNGVLANYAISVNTELSSLQEENNALLSRLKHYLSGLQ